MKRFWILRAIKIVLLVILAVLAIGYVVMSLWNWLVPALFGGPVITFFQALGVLVLSKILFGGFKGGHHKHCNHCGHNHSWKGKWGRQGNWRQHLKDKLESKMANMSEEEKEKLKTKFKNRCGFWLDDKDEDKENTNKE